MKTLKRQKEHYVVIEVYKGIPTSAKLFTDKKAAEKHERNLRKRINIEEDETGLFKI